MNAILLLRVLMLCAQRLGCPAWVNPETPDSEQWRHVRRWIESAFEKTVEARDAQRIEPSVAKRTLDQIDAWLTLFDGCLRDPLILDFVLVRAVLLPAAVAIGWKPSGPDTGIIRDGHASAVRWAEVAAWVRAHLATAGVDSAAVRLNCEAWLALFVGVSLNRNPFFRPDVRALAESGFGRWTSETEEPPPVALARWVRP